MKKIGEFFKLKIFTFKFDISTKEDKTDINLLLRQLLNERSIEESLKLKQELDLRYTQIMESELSKKTEEKELILNYLNNPYEAGN